MARKLRPRSDEGDPPARVVEGWRIIGAIVFVATLPGAVLVLAGRSAATGPEPGRR